MKDKGVALILAMFILVFISILVVAFLNLLTSDLVITANHLGRLRALYTAEAGVEYAISQLRTSVDWSAPSGETMDFPTGSGSSYTATRTAGSRVIESSGQVDNNKFKAKIEARISIRSANPNIIRIVSYKEKETN